MILDMTQSEGEPETRALLSEQDLIDRYGLEAQVVSGTFTMTLGQALAFEKDFCQAPEEAKADPLKRVRFLAKMLQSGGSLLPEDEYLIRPEDET